MALKILTGVRCTMIGSVPYRLDLYPRLQVLVAIHELTSTHVCTVVQYIARGVVNLHLLPFESITPRKSGLVQSEFLPEPSDELHADR